MAEGNTVDLGQYIAYLDKRLGRGTFGNVYLGREKTTKRKVAIKRIQYREETGITNSFMIKMSKIEVETAMSLNGHPNVVKFLDYFDNGIAFWLTLEYCPLGDLDNYLHDNCNNLDLGAKVNMMLQCVTGIAFMHSFKPPIVHRDIKPKNFLISAVSGSKDVITVKATDFGVAKLLEKQNKDFSSTYGKSLYMNTFVGSPAFMAPEMFEMDKELHYSSTVDIFSLGLLLQVLLMFSPEYKSTIPQLGGLPMKLHTVGQMMQEALRCGEPIPELLPEDADDSEVVGRVKAIIRSMTKVKPKERTKLWIAEDELRNIQEYMESGGACLADKKLNCAEASAGNTGRRSGNDDCIIDEQTLATLMTSYGVGEPKEEDGSKTETETTIAEAEENPSGLDEEDGTEDGSKTETETTIAKAEENPSGLNEEDCSNPIKHPFYKVTNYGDFSSLKDIMDKMNLGNPGQPAGKPRKPPADRSSPKKLNQKRLADFNKRPAPVSRPKSSPNSKGSDEETEKEKKRSMFAVSNINNFQNIKDIMAKFDGN